MHAAAQPEGFTRAAVQSLKSGDTVAAEAWCRRALALDSRHAPTLSVLGLIQHGAGRFGEAEQTFLELTRLQPTEAVHWMNLGTARRAAGRADDALRAYARAAELGARSAEFHYNLALAHIDRSDFESAYAVLAKAVALKPAHAEFRYRFAQVCYETLRNEEAIAALRDWAQLQELRGEVLASIAQLLTNLGEAQAARQALDRALRAGPLTPEATLTLAQVLERTNRTKEARELMSRISSAPRSPHFDTELALTRARLAQRDADHERAVALLRQVLCTSSDFHLQHHQLFPLAKSLDALGRHDEAFETLMNAHRSQVEYLGMTAPAIALRGAPTMVITQLGCDPADVAKWDDSGAPSVADSPIFIVAFPRSGTTLLELTLDAHPLLKSMDEQPFLQNALDDLIALGVRYPAQLGELRARQLDAVRAKYWERTRRKVELAPGQRLVDKNPLNILRLPVIRRLFPNARIILAIRHPCDVLLSCLMQHFRAPDFALLCRDLPTLANAFVRTFDFWYSQAALLRPAIHEVRYETFVSDFHNEVRRLAEFLELPWHDALLQPAANAQAKGFISTPSYSQVVQPISTRSVNRWRAYARHFASVLPHLQGTLDRWGYEGLGSTNSR